MLVKVKTLTVDHRALVPVYCALVNTCPFHLFLAGFCDDQGPHGLEPHFLQLNSALAGLGCTTLTLSQPLSTTLLEPFSTK